MGCLIIGEIGSNHQGDIDRAIDLINIAKKAGCGAIKFQLIPPFAPDWLDPLMEICKIHEIEFMATPFDQKGIDALQGKVKHWKIASTEAANQDFVDSVFIAAKGDPVFVSDGAVENLMHWPNLVRMACVVKYPAELEDYHFPIGTWGLSDHTLGTWLAPIAVAAGAVAVEKHITDDSTREGPDHAFALEPDELKEMVDTIRLVERIKANKKQTITTYTNRRLTWY